MKIEDHCVNPGGSRGESSNRWGIVLAGGDGKRLLPFTKGFTGDDRPKQFCAVVGDETLLEQTRRRVRRIVDPLQTLVVVTKHHQRFYGPMAGHKHGPQVLVQPSNRGTAPAIAFGMEWLHGLDPEGIAAIFPSDHYIADEDAFAVDLDTAFTAAQGRPDRILLLGVSPDSPEEGYGWVEPGEPLGGGMPDAIRGVRRFWEKPSPQLASELMKRGCLWNSFVMIGKVDTFRNLVRRALPGTMKSFESIRETFRTSREECALRDLYLKIPSTNFSHQVLAAYPGDLAVLRSANLGWSDLGEPSRVLAVLAGRRGESGPTYANGKHKAWAYNQPPGRASPKQREQ